MRNMTGGRMTQPNLRGALIVYDRPSITKVDAVLATHPPGLHLARVCGGGAAELCRRRPLHRPGSLRGDLEGVGRACRALHRRQAR